MNRILNIAPRVVPFVVYLLTIGGNFATAPVAEAMNGQCKWENGPGYPTYQSCRSEDCLGKGGLAICTAPEIRPPMGFNDSQTDGQKFGYSMCDVAGPSIPRIARWCAALGGTWVVVGWSDPVCKNLPPQYPNLGSATSEGAALAGGNQFMTMGNSCPPALTGDTGWGLVDNTDQLCWSGAPVFQNGELLRDMRRQTWTGTSPCTGGGQVKYMKSRRLLCPNEYAARTNPVTHELQCFIPKAQCNIHGNPVDCSIGAKLQAENDYRSGDGLAFSRYYNSQGRYRLPDGSGTGFLSEPSDYWRHSFSRRLLIVTGNAELGAVLRTDNGYIVAFDAAGFEIHNDSGAARRLQSLGASGWKITQTNSDVEYYDTQGRPTSVVTRAGLTTSLAYDAFGLLTTISNSFGRSLTLNYAGGVLASVTLPGGEEISYGYDDLGRLVVVNFPDSTSKAYHYEDSNNGWLLTGITDENNVRFSTYKYSTAGYVESEEHAGGVDKYSFQIGDPKSSTSTSQVVDPLGKSRSFTSSRTLGVNKIQGTSSYCPGCPNISSSSFDANGNYSFKSDFNGRRTNYVYDLTRNLETSRTEGLVGSGQTTAVTRTITTEWHPTFRLPTLEKVYAGASATGTPLRTTSYSYDPTGNMLTRTVADVAQSVSRTVTYTYDSFGRMLSEDGPRTDVSDVTIYTYYVCSYGAECGQLQSVMNALGHVTTYNTYNAHGQPTLITDANGVQTSLSYDSRQRLIRQTKAFATADAETTTFEYWSTGLLKKTTRPSGAYLMNFYDDAHRLIRVEDGAGNKLEYILDGMGKIQVTNTFDPYGTLVKTRRQLYTALGDLWQSLTASGTDNEATVYSYDQNGNQTAVSAPLGRVTTSVYDELNRLKQSIDPAGTSTLFAYNALDDVTQTTDPRGLVTSYQYNGFGDLKQSVSPDTGTTTYGYDSGGNLQSKTNARNAVTTQSYDSLNRINAAAYSVGGSVDQALSFIYDLGANGKGHMTAASDSNHSLAWSYDHLGRVTNKSQTVGGVTKSIAYGYANGRAASLLTPSGQTISYSYDTIGRMVGITVNGNPLISNITYDSFGPISGWIWGSGSLMVRNFDLDGRVNLIDSAGLSTYTYDVDGSIASRLDDVNSTYMLAAGSTAVGVSNTSNRLTGTTGVLQRTYAYDTAGSTIGDGTATFTYNFADRMSSASKAGITATYTYNALGQRVRKSVGAATIFFVYDEAGHLLGQYDGAGALIEEVVWLGDIPVATLRPSGPGAVSLYYIHTDHLNTPRRVTRPSDNQIVWRWDSDPYGEAAANEDPDEDSQSFVLNLRFPGQFRDAETGLNYNHFRDYDPAVGRYVESDPIGLSGGEPSTFTYAYDDPLAFTDPRGLRPPGGAIDFRNFIRDSFFGGRFPDKDFRSDGMPWGWGCGDAGTDKIVPDGFFMATFFPGCRRHDDCYGTCGTPKAQWKAQCDRRLLQDLLDSCDYEGYGIGCKSVARTYYAAMKTRLSQAAFDRAQDEACKECVK
jgi:RHS repeat-associated protein